MHETTTAPDLAPVIPMAAPPLARRLYRVAEAADYHHIPRGTIRVYVWERRLPTVALPGSRVESPTRRIRCVPAAWLDHWLEMADRDRDDLQLPDRATFVATGTGPRYLGIAQAEATLGVNRSWIHRAVDRGDFPEPVAGIPTWRLSRLALDGWLWDLIAQAEADWYGEAATMARRYMPGQVRR